MNAAAEALYSVQLMARTTTICAIYDAVNGKVPLVRYYRHKQLGSVGCITFVSNMHANYTGIHIVHVTYSL